MKQTVNKVYAPIFKENARYFILMGGRGAGRSTVASQLANAKLVAPEYFRCAIMRYILGDVRNSIYREITDRIEENGIEEVIDVNSSIMSLTYGVNSINAVGFRKSSSDQRSKLKSLANYNCVIVEEADEIPEEDFMQLDDSLRTIKGDITVILLLNPPPKNHWIIKRWFDLNPSEAPGFYIPTLKPEHTDTVFIHTNYEVNKKNLSEQIVKNYERYKETKPQHYWNMVKGYVPEVKQGKIYDGWKVIDEVPHEARLECYGLDFGFHPDPCAIVAIYYYNGGYILDEILYQTDLKNRQIATVIQNQLKAVVVADHAEPKSIAEMKDEFNLNIIPCVKGADSVRFGIKKVQALQISYTRRSRNLAREYENYAWKVNKDGEEEDVVDPKCEDHCMDALRYGFLIADPSENDAEKEREILFNRREREELRQDAGLMV